VKRCSINRALAGFRRTTERRPSVPILFMVRTGEFENGGIKMKKTIVIVALIFTLGAFVIRPSAEVPRHVVLETLSPQARMLAAGWLPKEGYDAI
jgi:hypothetical protein